MYNNIALIENGVALLPYSTINLREPNVKGYKFNSMIVIVPLHTDLVVVNWLSETKAILSFMRLCSNLIFFHIQWQRNKFVIITR